jgi:hypothetical protein
MNPGMRTSGAGRELLVLLWGLGVVAGLSSCARPEATAERGSVEASPGELVREPQQVVQRMVPVSAHSTDATSSDAPSSDTPSAMGSAAAESPVARRTAEGERHAVEPITSKHLEAELNRLEAELGQ